MPKAMSPFVRMRMRLRMRLRVRMRMRKRTRCLHDCVKASVKPYDVVLCLRLRKVLRIESLHGAILATGYAYANAYAYAYGGMETALDNSMGAIFLTDTHTHTLTLTHTHADKRRHSLNLPFHGVCLFVYLFARGGWLVANFSVLKVRILFVCKQNHNA